MGKIKILESHARIEGDSLESTKLLQVLGSAIRTEIWEVKGGTYTEVTLTSNDDPDIDKLSSLVHVSSSKLADCSYPFNDGGVPGNLGGVQESETTCAGGHPEGWGIGNVILNGKVSKGACHKSRSAGGRQERNSLRTTGIPCSGPRLCPDCSFRSSSSARARS